MMSTWFRALPRAPHRSLVTALSLALLATLTACGGVDRVGVHRDFDDDVELFGRLGARGHVVQAHGVL